MEKRPDYKYLIERFSREATADKPAINGADIIKARMCYMEKRAMDFIQSEKIQDYVHVSPSILDIVILDYFADIARLKDFEDGLEFTNKNKITAFMAYWWIRRKPIQVVKLPDEERDERLVYVNEKFIATLIAKEFMYSNPKAYNNDKCDICLNHIYYHLKYRVYTAQTLELFLMGIDTGIEIGKITH